MKKHTKKLLFAFALLSVTMFFHVQVAKASAPMTEEQLNQYQNDGSLDERIQYYESTGTTEISDALIQKHTQGDLATYSSLFPDTWMYHDGLMPSEGDNHILLLRVDFPDQSFAESDTLEALHSIAFDTADESNPYYPYESLSAYYERASYGTMHISGDTYNYTAQHEQSYYGTNIQSLFEEALTALDSEIDYQKYDGNQDGYMDGLYLHFAGSDSGWGSVWWSCAYAFPRIDGEYDGVKIGYYATLHQPSNSKLGAQTLIHETGHLLGLPDYYSYTQQGDYNSGIRTYDMMFDNCGDFNGFSKWLLGWIKDDEILRISVDDTNSVSKSVTLNSLSALTDDSNGYKLAIISPLNNGIFSEYLLVEYDTGINNQAGLCYQQNALPDGFRIFHVNAALNDSGLGFNYCNQDATQQKLIEALDLDQSTPHSYHSVAEGTSYTEVAGPVDSDYHCKYIAGDSLTPDTNPSSRLDTVSEEKNGDIYVSDFSPQGNTGTVTITMNSFVPSPDNLQITIGELWKDTAQSNLIILPVKLSIAAALNPNAASPVLISKDGKEITGQLLTIGRSQEYYLIIQSDYLDAGDYQLKLPANTFDLGQNVGSNEQILNLQIGKNMPLKTSGTLTLGFRTLSCASPDGGWYIFSCNEDKTAHLYKIDSTGTLTEHIIDFNALSDQFYYDAASMRMNNFLCLQDGTLVLTFDTEEITYLLHFNEQGELLGSVNSIDETNLTFSVINNTIKICKTKNNHTTTRLWSVDFKSDIKEIPVEYSTNHYIFLNTGYLVIYWTTDSFSDASTTYIEYRNESDCTVTTYQIPTHTDTQIFSPGSVMGGFETNSNFYLVTTKGINNSAFNGSHILAELSTTLYTINKETGDFLPQSNDSTVFRYSAVPTSFNSPQFSNTVEKNGKIFFSITNSYTDYSSPFVDTYCLDLKDYTIESRISSSGYFPHIVSGNQLLMLSNEAGSSVYKIYETSDISDTPGKSDISDKKDTPKTSSNQNPTGTSTNSGTTKNSKNTKTGDSISLAPTLFLALLGFAGICISIKKRKHKTL